MPGVDAWCALADEVVALGDPALRDRMATAVAGLGMTAQEREDLLGVISGREDPAGQLLLAAAMIAGSESETVEPPAAPPQQMDAALAESAHVLAGPAETIAARLGGTPRGVLQQLPPDAAGSLIAGVLGASLSLRDPVERATALRTVTEATQGVSSRRLPAAAILSNVVSANPSSTDLDSVAVVLARAPTNRLVSGALDALRDGMDPAMVIGLLGRVAEVRRRTRPRAGFPETPVAASAPPPPPSLAPPPAPPPEPDIRWRGGGRHSGDDMPAPAPAPRSTSAPEPPPTLASARQAYPRIDVDAHRAVRPEVVVVDQPFDVTVGLAKYQDTGITQSGAMSFMAGATTDLELVLVYDPNSLTPQGDTRLALTVSDANPYPSATVSFVAQYRPDLPMERRIGVHYLRAGQVVGIAWRTIVAVTYEKDVPTAPALRTRPDTLLDLEPLLGVDLPDLILSICASDGAATGEFVWTAYAGASDVTVPDAPRVSNLDSDLQGFVTEMRQAVAFSQGPYNDFLTLTGKAKRLGRAVPEGIRTVIREVVEDGRRHSAATILLLTEELTLPWELAVFDQPFTTTWGGLSPFLGAHAAISRWPLTQHKPRPTPRAAVTVKRAAVLTADYAGVPGWGKLDFALAEAQEIAALFAPPAVTVRPSLRDVVSMLRGTPPADVLHVALHGQFDAKGAQEGLVLLGSDAMGQLTTKPQFFTPDQVENGHLDGGPFVFLNACQVASDKRVLGDYGGFASTLLRIGASGVVAPLWNVDDDIAAAFARQFYESTWTATGTDGSPASVSAAEAVRAVRARYTEAAAESETPGITATLIAFQVFGHPRLRLDHS